MTPIYHAHLVNGRTGDPALYIDFRFEKRALLFDLGDLHALSSRKLVRVEQVFLSHTHIDHFIGFDQLLRVALGRGKRITIYGPAGVIDNVGAKLGAYTWNLVDRFEFDLRFKVIEIVSESEARSAAFRLKNRFQREELTDPQISEGLLAQSEAFRVDVKILDHQVPSLGFSLLETAHVNVWKNRLEARGLPVGPWLRDLKQAVLEGKPDDCLIQIYGRKGGEQIERCLPLGVLREDILQIVPGQKIAYVTDAAFTPANAVKIRQLADGADLLFIEAMFAHDDRELAQARAHLTTAQAGRLARDAGVRRIEPFHFSPRYEGREDDMLREVERAFGGRLDP